MNDFQYDRLDPQKAAFRLLRLLKGHSIEVKCEIFDAMISDHTYEALSYTWGTGELVESIELNERKLWITENLHSALQCLRSRLEDRVLWIDAICINQADLEERSRQVQQMGSIFGSAKRVIFWLGKPTADAQLLMNCLRMLQERNRQPEAKKIPLQDLWSDIQTYQPDLASRQQEGLRVLLKRPWFKRVWILQEVANARSAVVCSGDLYISAEVFALSPILLGISPEPHVQVVLDIMPKQAVFDSWWTQDRGLINLLDKFRASETTDKRDMIFALLGISSDDHQLLHADYTKSIDKIVHNTVRYWLEATRLPLTQIFDFLANFTHVRATFIVPTRKNSGNMEAIHNLSIIDPDINERPRSRFFPSNNEVKETTIQCSRDASLFVLEQDQAENTVYREMESLYTEMNSDHEFSLRRQGENSLQLVPWGLGRNLKLLIVGDPVRALTLTWNHDLRRTCDLLLDLCTSNKQGLLEATFKSLGHGSGKLKRFLLDKGLKMNAYAGRYGNALLEACMFGDVDWVRTLIDHGEDIHAVDSRGTTALQMAALGECENAVKILLDRGADVNAKGGEYGTALAIAVHKDRVDVVNLLLEHGADINPKGRLPLQVACENGKELMVRSLIDRGAEINARSSKGTTALHIASKKGYEQIVQVLLEHGADVNAANEFYGTPLSQAVCGAHDRIVRMLLDRGADIYGPGKLKMTALQEATRAWSPENRQRMKLIVQMLLDQNADVNAPGDCIESALESASKAEDEEIMEMLINKGADVNVLNERGQTILIRAVLKNRPRAARVLVRSHADLTTVDKYGRTAIDWLKLRGTDDRLLKSICNNQSQPSWDKQQLRSYIVSLATSIVEAESVWQRAPDLRELGHCFVMLKDIGNALYAFLHESNVQEVRCSGCRQFGYDFEDNRFICTICPDLSFCGACMDACKERLRYTTCYDHEFFEIPLSHIDRNDAGKIDYEAGDKSKMWLHDIINGHS